MNTSVVDENWNFINPDGWTWVVSSLDGLIAQEVRRRTRVDIWDDLRSMLPVHELIQEVREASRACDHGIDQSVADWSLGHRLCACTRIVNTWRFERMRCAQSFLGDLTAAYDIPERPFCWKEGVSTESAIKWLLTDWWYDRGVAYYATWHKGTWCTPGSRNDISITKNRRSRRRCGP
jgi:hypothetical protein